MDGSTSCSASTSCARPTCPGVSVSAIRSFAMRSTRRPQRAGDWARTSVVLPRSRRTAPRRSPARTTSSDRRARAISTRCACLPRPAANRSAWRRRAPRTGSHESLRLLPHTAPASERTELLRARAEALTATGRYADSHERTARGAGARAARSRTRCSRTSPARAPRPRACSGGRSRRRSASGRHSSACGPSPRAIASRCCSSWRSTACTRRASTRCSSQRKQPLPRRRHLVTRRSPPPPWPS